MVQQKMVAVSVVMPAYNAERTILSSVNSVLHQTFTELELIVCDDASTDDTVAILAEISDPRLRVVKNNTNRGPGVSRDSAVDTSVGRWLSFTDADDEWAHHRLEKMLRVAKTNADSIVFDNILECHDTANGLIPWREMRRDTDLEGVTREWGTEVPLENFLRSRRLLIKPLIPAELVKRNHLRHLQRPDSKEPVEDADYFIRVMACGAPLCYIPEPMYFYRITAGSATSRSDRLTRMIEVLESAKTLFADRPLALRALDEKLQMVRQDADYMPFMWALKKREFRTAIAHAKEAPWVLGEFGVRSFGSAWYQLHRLWHAGRSRGVR